jgi:hypothetical protein
MIDMITTALDVGIMAGIVMFVAFGLTLRPRSLRGVFCNSDSTPRASTAIGNRLKT